MNTLLSRLERKRRVAHPRAYPRELDLVLTKACNLNCTFCISSTVGDDRWLDYDLFERVAAELFPRALRLSLCSGGEPLLYPRLRDVLRTAQGHGVKTLIVSNGMLLEADIRQWMVEDQSLDQYLVSFDGSTPETLQRIRRGARFDTIVANVTALARERDAAGRAFPRLGLRYSVMQSNAEELPGICELAASMGVAEVIVNYVSFANDMSPEDSLFFNQDLAERVFAETRVEAAKHGVSVQLPPVPRDDHGPHQCSVPWDFVQIETDGQVRFCYMAWIQTVGNFNDGFADVWRGDDYAKLRSTMNSDEPYFQYCEFCSWRNGCNTEAAHSHSLHADAFTFRGENTATLAFNKRSEENRAAFKDTTSS